jgi:hypothetical protein
MPRWFLDQQMVRLDQNVMHFAAQNQVVPLTEFPAHYHQIDVLFVSMVDQLIVLLHVPATHKGKMEHLSVSSFPDTKTWQHGCNDFHLPHSHRHWS